MLKVFQHDLADPEKFIVTLELVPGRDSFGKSVDSILGLAEDAFNDNRISAVSITDNPGGNPSISPDVLGYEIFKRGLDVIVHCTCRDMNRTGLESRALQLARMGMKNILALTGDYPGKGFGGQGAPVFDLDSVTLTSLLAMLSQRLEASGDLDGFFTGCAVSPFKTTEAETFAQYGKLARKINAGASFVITQLGYDVNKYQELIQVMETMNTSLPVLGSVYLLSPRAARAMNKGRVPGVAVSDILYQEVIKQWESPRQGLAAAIERTAWLGVSLKNMGYRGIHLGGIHKSFDTVAAILDRMEEIEKNSETPPETLAGPPREKKQIYYIFPNNSKAAAGNNQEETPGIIEKTLFSVFSGVHQVLFNFDSPLAPLCRAASVWIENKKLEHYVRVFLEDPVKKLLLSCHACGDCGIRHLAFQCPESGCPKHMRNGACGGSNHDKCEVYPDRDCIWVKAYRRLKWAGKSSEMSRDCIPPRMWELYHTSAWINFHLKKDHESKSQDLISVCSLKHCSLNPILFEDK